MRQHKLYNTHKGSIYIGILMICLSFFAIQKAKAQQEPMYSQYMFNMIQINPAYAGNRATNNVTAVYRKQWVGIEGAPVTANISWDKRNEDSNVGYGLQVYSDKIGIESTVGIQGFYSFRIATEESSLSLGISAGILNYRADYIDVTTNTSNDPMFSENVNGFRPTFGIGALYARENWYAGLSIPALLQTKIYHDNVSVTSGASNHYFLTGGYIFRLEPDFKVKPSILFKAVTGAPLEVDLNINGWYKDLIGLGASYRTGDSFVGMFEVQLTPQVRLGYAYDYPFSVLNQYSNGTHEIMLRYEFSGSKKTNIISPRYY